MSFDLKRLDSLDRLAAPAGTWRIDEADRSGVLYVGDCTFNLGGHKHNARLVSELRNAAPEMIAELVAGRAWLQAYDHGKTTRVFAAEHAAREYYRVLTEWHSR